MNTDQAPASEAPASVRTKDLVARNALFLISAQVLITPISAFVGFLMARYIGAADFGRLYLLGTFCGFVFLAVEWGQGSTVAALVARDRKQAGLVVGTGLVWRIGSALVATAMLGALALVLGRDTRDLQLLGLWALGAVMASVAAAYLEAVRGFERGDITAYAQVGGQLLNAACIGIALALSGELRAVLLAQAIGGVVMTVVAWRAFRPLGKAVISVSWPMLKTLLKDGLPFLFFGMAMALQPNIDAFFMTRYVPAEVVGWHAGAARLVGVLVVPANGIIRALYPTLCRLHVENTAAFLATARGAIRTTTILAAPLALACALYPGVGIGILGEKSFGPAETNVRILSLFLLLVYFSMPIGVCLLAGGRQRIWSLVQVVCVCFSVALDPFLIPYFQRTAGNGSLGVCVASVASEAFMVGLGVVLSPKGLFDRSLLRQLSLAAIAGLVMYAASRSTSTLPVLVSATLALGSYFACMWLTGGIDKEQLAGLRGALSRKFSR